MRSALWVCAALCLLIFSACQRTQHEDAHRALVSDQASQSSKAQESLEGYWIVDAQTYFERDLGVEVADFVTELAASRRMGYAIHDDVLEFRLATPEANIGTRAAYTIVQAEGDAIVIRLFNADETHEAEEILVENALFKFRFSDAEHAEQYVLFVDEADREEIDEDAIQNAELSDISIPLIKVSAETYDAHFEGVASHQERYPELKRHPEDQEFLVGSWVLNLQDEALEKEVNALGLHAISLRYLPLYVQFFDTGYVRIGSVDSRPDEIFEGTYRATVYDTVETTAKYIQLFSREDEEQAYPQLWRWTQDNENSIHVMMSEDPADLRALERVSDKQLIAYRAQDYEAPSIDEAAQKKARQRLSGYWLLDLPKTLELGEQSMHQSFVDGFALGFHVDAKGRWVIAVREEDMGEMNVASFDVLNDEGDSVLVRLRYDEDSGTQELVLSPHTDSEWLVYPSITEAHSPAYVASERVVMKRASQKDFEAIFGTEE